MTYDDRVKKLAEEIAEDAAKYLSLSQVDEVERKAWFEYYKGRIIAAFPERKAVAWRFVYETSLRGGWLTQSFVSDDYPDKQRWEEDLAANPGLFRNIRVTSLAEIEESK